MGVLMMLQEADAKRIEALKKRLGAKTKVEVVRTALDRLERDADRAGRVAQWERAVKLAAPASKKALAEFRRYSRLRHHD